MFVGDLSDSLLPDPNKEFHEFMSRKVLSVWREIIYLPTDFSMNI